MCTKVESLCCTTETSMSMMFPKIAKERALIYPCNGILFEHKKEWGTDMCNHIEELGNTMTSWKHHYKGPSAVWFSFNEIFRMGRSVRRKIDQWLPRDKGMERNGRWILVNIHENIWWKYSKIRLEISVDILKVTELHALKGWIL